MFEQKLGHQNLKHEPKRAQENSIHQQINADYNKENIPHQSVNLEHQEGVQQSYYQCNFIKDSQKSIKSSIDFTSNSNYCLDTLSKIPSFDNTRNQSISGNFHQQNSHSNILNTQNLNHVKLTHRPQSGGQQPSINLQLRTFGQIQTNQPPTPAPIQTPHTHRNMSSMKPPLESTQKFIVKNTGTNKTTNQKQAQSKIKISNPYFTQRSHSTSSTGVKQQSQDPLSTIKKFDCVDTSNYSTLNLSNIKSDSSQSKQRSFSLGQSKRPQTAKPQDKKSCLDFVSQSQQQTMQVTPKSIHNKIDLSSALKNINKSNVNILVNQNSFSKGFNANQPIKKLKIIKIKKSNDNELNSNAQGTQQQTTNYVEKRNQVKIFKASQITRNSSLNKESNQKQATSQSSQNISKISSNTMNNSLESDKDKSIKERLNVFYKQKLSSKDQPSPVFQQFMIPQTARNVPPQLITNQAQNSQNEIDHNICQTTREVMPLPQNIFNYTQPELIANHPQTSKQISMSQQYQQNNHLLINRKNENINLQEIENTENTDYSELLNQLQDDLPDHKKKKRKSWDKNHAQNAQQNETQDEDSQDFINNLIKFNVDMQQFIQQKDQLQNQIEQMRQPSVTNYNLPQYIMMPDQQQQKKVSQVQQQDVFNYQLAKQQEQIQINPNYYEKPNESKVTSQNYQQLSKQYQEDQTYIETYSSNQYINIHDVNESLQSSTASQLLLDDNLLTISQSTINPQNTQTQMITQQQSTPRTKKQSQEYRMTTQGNQQYCISQMSNRTSSAMNIDDDEEMEYSSDEGGQLLESQLTQQSQKTLKAKDLL
eukprot:403338969